MVILSSYFSFVENFKNYPMKKIVLTFGLIIGTILCANMIVMVNMMYGDTVFKGNDIVGYTALIVLFSLIFFGVRNYRNRQLNGAISFGRAFKIGALIAFVASTMYVVIWLFYYYLFVPDLSMYIPPMSCKRVQHPRNLLSGPEKWQILKRCTKTRCLSF